MLSAAGKESTGVISKIICLNKQKEDEGIFREAILIMALSAQAAYADRVAFLKYLFLRQSKIITHARQGVPMLPDPMKT